MSGSRLGRGRGGRLAMYGGCGVVVLLLVFLYRAATSEMARLRDLHVQCAHQQEALAAQLQVIFEYKVRLEKSLAEEKSSNAAVKQELQQRATREKSLRDKDSIEAMQRFNSLQQTYKLLQTEHQDLQDECKKRESQALEDTKRLEATLQELRGRIRQARQDQEKSLENLKTKYLELDTEKTRLEKKYNEMLKTNGTSVSFIDHLKKEVFQLKHELEEAKRSSKRATSPGPSTASSQVQADQQPPRKDGSQADPAVRPSQQQQSPAPTSSVKSILSLKLETSTASAGSPASTALNKVLPQLKLAQKIKLPDGVVPIPVMIDPKLDKDQQEEIKKDEAKNVPAKGNDSKEAEQGDPEDLDPLFPALPGRHDDQNINRQDNPGWFKVAPGVQEVGDDLNNLGRFPGMDAGGDPPADDQYEDQYDKNDRRNSDLHIVDGGDEVEDEDDQLDYPRDLKQGKRE